MKKLVISLVVGLGIIVIPSVGAMLWITHSHDIYRTSLAIIRQSPEAERLIGTGIEPGLWISMRTSNKKNSGSAEYKVSGTRGAAEAIVSARRRDGEWLMHYIWLKPEQGRIVVVLDNR